MLQTNKIPKLHYWFLGIWFLLNLFQAGFTTLADDEAYYWLYGQHLDWGYFHQPPMIGAFIKAGYSLFENELGVRLVSVLLNSVGLHLIFTMTDRKDPKLFWAIIAGTLLTHVAGFFAVPDSPLIFFAALFLYLLKRYLEKDSMGIAILIGITAACMLMGKYHGILVLGFSLIANLHLFKRLSFYVLLVVSVAAFFPHVWWQISHDFPGFGYHLSGRFGDWFNYENTLAFLIGQLIITGPLIGFMTLYGAFKQKPTDKFIRTLKFVMVGEFVYFFLWSFKGQIEANWTASAFIGLFVLSYMYFQNRPAARKWIFRLSIPTIVLVLLVRVNMMTAAVDIVPVYKKMGEFHGWQDFVKRVKEKAGDRVIMGNSYQMASKLSFYLGTEVPSLNQFASGNEFDLWHLERPYANQDVAVILGGNHLGGEPILSPRQDTLYMLFRDNFKIFKDVTIVPKAEKVVIPRGVISEIEVVVNNPYSYPIKGDREIVEGTNTNSFLCYHWWKDGEMVVWDGIRTYPNVMYSGSTDYLMRLQAPEEPGKYLLQPCIVSYGDGWWSANEFYEVEVK